MDFKRITITTEGYSVASAQKAILAKAVADFPHATEAAISRMLGVSQPTISNWLKRWGITMGPKLSKSTLAAIELLKSKGFSVSGQKGLSQDRPERRGGARGRKKTVIDFESIEPGKYVTVPNLEYQTVKNYGVKWLKEQPDPTIRFRYAEDAEGIRVFRVQ